MITQKEQAKFFLSLVWRFSKGRRWNMLLVYLMFLIANIITMSRPLFLGLLFNTIQQSPESIISDSILWLSCFFGATFIFWMLHGPARVMERRNAFYIAQNFSEYTFQTLLHLPASWHADNHSWAIIDRIQKAYQAILSISQTLFQYQQMFIRSSLALVAVFVIMKWYGLVIVPFLFVILLVIRYFDISLVRNQILQNRQEHVRTAIFSDYITNIVTIISLRLEKLSQKQYGKIFEKILIPFRKVALDNELKWGSVTLIVALMVVTVLFVFIYSSFVTTGVVLVGTLTALYQYLDTFKTVFVQCTQEYHRLVQAFVNTYSVYDIYKESTKLVFSKNNKKLPMWKKIQVRNLNFTYENSEHQIATIDNVSIQLEKGRKIAFVGESGSGKTTILSLLRGLYKPDSISVFVDDKIEYNSIDTFSNHVSLIPQEPEIFENTIKHNITLGTRATKNTVEKAVKIACFDSVLARLPNGLETNIKERGVNLSGWEKQRLALARGVFSVKSSDIILLDESTSSVDPVNERRIYKHMFQEFKNKSIVASIHKLNLLDMFDYVYVFKSGKVVEEGKLEDLQKNKWAFARMWSKYEKSKTK